MITTSKSFPKALITSMTRTASLNTVSLPNDTGETFGNPLTTDLGVYLFNDNSTLYVTWG